MTVRSVLTKCVWYLNIVFWIFKKNANVYSDILFDLYTNLKNSYSLQQQRKMWTIALLQINVRFHLPCTDQIRKWEKSKKESRKMFHSKDMVEIWNIEILAEQTCELPSEEQTNHIKYTKCMKIPILFWPNSKASFFR
mgnify:CR=1 FL=1